MRQRKKRSDKARKGFFATPPLRYTGAKSQIADWIIEQFPAHDVYVEPFCGSAAVFFRKYRSPIEVLNDMDGEIINFFDVLRTQTDTLVDAIVKTPYAREEYERAFEPCDDPLERARRFYVSVWQSFGSTLVNKSGWRHQRIAKQRTPVVDQWKRLDGLMDAANRLKDAQIDCLPALECIRHYDGPATLFYVDPPYVLKSRQGKGRKRYRYEMGDEEHQKLAEVLREAEGMVLLSGYESDLYDELYGDWIRIEKSNTTNGQGKSLEVLWMSPGAVDGRGPLFSVGDAL